MPLTNFNLGNGAPRHVASGNLQLCRQLLLRHFFPFTEKSYILTNLFFNLSIHGTHLLAPI